jgi:hypothetical protein
MKRIALVFLTFAIYVPLVISFYFATMVLYDLTRIEYQIIFTVMWFMVFFSLRILLPIEKEKESLTTEHSNE